MRPRTLVVLLALVAGLGGFIWFFERELPSTDERVEQAGKLVRLDIDSVRVISLAVDERRVRLERTPGFGDAGEVSDVGEPDGESNASGDEWVLTEPRSGRADAAEVQDLLESVRDLERERTLEDVSRAELGLDSPRAEIKFEFEIESEGVVLRFGSEIPASSNTIVEVGSGPPFYVVADSLFEDIDRDPNDWRSRDAIPVQRSRIARVEVLNPPTGVVLERAENGFRLVQPVEDLADEARVSDLLAALVELEIEEFVDDPKGDFDATPLALELTVSGEAEPMLVEIAPAVPAKLAEPAEALESAQDLSLVRVNGEVFRAATGLAALLELLPAEWQSSSWSDWDAFEIEGFQVVRSESETSFERREGEWLRGEVEIEYSTVSTFLQAVASATGAPVGSATGPGETPELRIDLTSSEGAQTLRLWANGGSYLAEREGRATLIRLAPESAEDLFTNLEALEAAPPKAVDSD